MSNDHSIFHQELPGRDRVCWQELAPPGGELTAQALGDACHPMAPRASTHVLSVRPPAHCCPPQGARGAIIVLFKKGPALRVCHKHQGLLFTVSS
jgi:hypothetical protein